MVTKHKSSANTRETPYSLMLALQGGGTHAALAWGALDALLARGVKIDAISAASAGSLNAVVLAEGMRTGGTEGARKALHDFWYKVSVAARMLPIRPMVWDKFLGEVGIDFSPTTIAIDYFTKLFSPYQFNLFDFNPLREIVREMVDFNALRKDAPFPLYINTTHARTGESRIFTHSELGLQEVMASCSLPYMFKSVEINGEAYWDGGYSGNPPLKPLYEGAEKSTIVLVETIPAYTEEVPMQAADILDQATEISFNANLRHEKIALDAYNSLHADAPVELVTLHAREVLANLGRASKLNADWDFLSHLKELGAQSVADWLGGQ